MIRTKYLLIVIVLCLVAMLSGGFITAPDAGVPAVTQTVLFTETPPAFTIVPTDARSAKENRQTFISEIRSAIASDPIREPVVESVQIETDTVTPTTTDDIAPVSSSTTGTTDLAPVVQ